MTRHRFWATIAITTALLVAACGGGSSSEPSEVNVPETVVPIEPGDYQSPTWLPSGEIVFINLPDPDRGLPGYQLWKVRPDGTRMGQVDVPFDDTTCPPPTRWIDRPVALADGRVGLVMTCGLVRDVTYRLVALDVATGVMEELTAPLVAPASPFLRPSSYTWDPSLSRAFAAASSIICAGIVDVDRDGVHLLDITVGEGDGAWRLDEEFLRGGVGTGADPCTETGRADLPAWSSDGERVAFVGSPASIGVAGDARADQPWDLYVMDPDGSDQQVVVEGLRSPTRLAWSPDNEWIAYNLAEGPDEGGWLVEVATGQRHQIWTGNGARVDWSPDGDQVVALRPGGSDDRPEASIVIYDVGDIVDR